MWTNQETAAFLARVSAKVVSGTILVMLVLGSLSYSPPRNLAVIATLFALFLGIILSNTYAETINEVIRQHRVVPWRDLWPILVKQTWLMSSTLVPITFFVMASLGLITQYTAFRLTKLALVIVLFSFGFLARRLCGGSLLRASSYGALAAAVGLVLVEIKLLVKYLPAMGQ